MPARRINSRQRGRLAENVALKYLENHGLKLVTRNYHASGGEIDLIMQDRETIIFIEVRYRENSNHHNPAESIDPGKCRRIINTSQRFLQVNRKMTTLDCRFDVIILSGSLEKPSVEWINNAFQA
ncbi:MAG TPA: YraN family protein [Gammaproteobacteria bacterium]|nr:YraN family protein [Gammaproteobacteria bacterium]